MTIGQPFLQALLGSNARIVNEAAFGADLTDIDGSGWTWTDLGSDPRHNPGIPITVGRSDNVGQAGAASYSTTLNNQAGDYTPGGPNAAHNVTQNTPWRQRMTLDGSTWFIRFQGYLDSANPVTDQSAKVRGVAVAAFGMLARLGGLKKPLRSSMYRAISGSSPAAWWPMEEGASSVNFKSAVIGVAALAVAGAVTLGADGNAGAAASGDFSGGGTASTKLLIPVTTSFRASILVTTTTNSNDGTGQPNNSILQIGTTGGVGTLEIGLNATTVSVGHTLDTGAVSTFIGLPDGVTGPTYLLVADFTNSGASVNATINVNGVDVLFGTFTGNVTAVISAKIGGPTALTFPDGDHAFKATALTIWSPWGSSVDLPAAARGYAGETADDRLTRLCSEQGIALDLTGSSNVTMGPQGVDTILNLLRECEATDHGVLYDGLGPGIGYQCRSARYNTSGVLTLDMGADPPQVTSFGAVFDKQAVKNLYTVNRKNGGSATAEQTDGPVGTNLIGVEDAAVTINTDTDDVLAGHATWLVHLGTVEGFRFPGNGLDMRGVASKAPGVLALSVGDRITIHRPASKATDLPPDDIALIVEGWTETTTASTWTIALNTSPYDPWRVAAVADPANPWVVAPGAAALNAAINATVLSASIKSTDGTLLSTSAGDYPRPVRIGAEEITISSVTGSSSPQTAVIVRSVNGVVKSHSANEPLTLYKPAAIAL